MDKKHLLMILCVFAVITWGMAAQEEQPDMLHAGIDRYHEGKWYEALTVLQMALAELPADAEQTEALYWIALSQFALNDYANAVGTLEELNTLTTGDRKQEILLYRGQAYYYLDRYNEAITVLTLYYNTSGDPAQKAEALYWTGECLFSMGQFERAQDVFSMLAEQYPSSRQESVSYRRALLDQKKIETELLALLQWSHEESLRATGEYQRRERYYDQVITNLQKQITDMRNDTRLADLESANAVYQSQVADYEARIASLETQLKSSGALSAPAPGTPSDRMARLLSLKNSAMVLQSALAGGSQ